MKKRKMIWDVLYPTVFMLLAVLAVTMAVSVIAGLFTGNYDINSDELHAVPLLASAVFYVVVLISQRRQFQLDEMRFGPDRKRPEAAVLLPAVLVTMCAADLLENIIAGLHLYELFPQYETVAVQAFRGQNLPLLILTTVILAPPAEELMFRGMTYRRAKSWFGPKRAALISAALFGLYHMNVIQFLFGFFIAVLFAWIYEHTETLLVPVCCHAAANAWELILEYGIDQPGRLTGRGRGILLTAEALICAAGLLFLYRQFAKKRAEENPKNGYM